MRRVLAVVGVGAVLAFAGCGGDDEEQAPSGRSGGGAAAGQDAPEAATETQTATPTPTEEGGGGTATAAEGKQLFTRTCGGCHTLSDAGTNGQVGPNLDELQPDKERVLTAIQQGPGTMPDNLYEGADAEAVAEYVSSVAGQS